MSAEIIHGDCLDVLPTLAAESADAGVSDPPYGFSFMGKAWDHGVPGVPFWEATRRVLKPGAYLVAFGGPRTFHRLACHIEDAGFEIQDTLSWLFGSGFPKHKSKLKPAWEPIILARKPAPKATLLNIDACRIGTEQTVTTVKDLSQVHGNRFGVAGATYPKLGERTNPPGRWPANVVLDEEAARALDEASGVVGGGRFTNGGAGYDDAGRGTVFNGGFRGASTAGMPTLDTGGASRFYYTAKASRREREAGLDGFAQHANLDLTGGDRNRENARAGTNRNGPLRAANVHPTVKPLALMRWLVRLVTPEGGLVLDPFTGSGSTGCAAVLEGRRFVGIEREAEYVAIARARVAHWQRVAADVQPALPLDAA